MSILIDFTTKTYYYPTLSNHLYNKFGLSVETSSLYFTINMISYFFFLRFTDPITQRIGVKATMLMGHVVNLISVLFVSPLDIFPQ
jgi:fucose permease